MIGVFLPWLIGHRDPPIEHLLSACGGEYRVRVRYGTSEHHQSRDWVISFERLAFAESLAHGEPQEDYWANDLEDYLDGRCDDFSTFCRTPLALSHLLWDCLGMPFLNDDLVARKLRFHFERAARGESVDDWVLGFYRDWMTPPKRCTRRV